MTKFQLVVIYAPETYPFTVAYLVARMKKGLVGRLLGKWLLKEYPVTGPEAGGAVI
jgi:hypothetical protein